MGRHVLPPSQGRGSAYALLLVGSSGPYCLAAAEVRVLSSGQNAPTGAGGARPTRAEGPDPLGGEGGLLG